MNPFRELRLHLGYHSATSFAQALGVSPSAICAAERGAYVYPIAVITALAQRGYDVGSLMERYTAWRMAQIEAETHRMQEAWQAQAGGDRP